MRTEVKHERSTMKSNPTQEINGIVIAAIKFEKKKVVIKFLTAKLSVHTDDE